MTDGNYWFHRRFCRRTVINNENAKINALETWLIVYTSEKLLQASPVFIDWNDQRYPFWRTRRHPVPWLGFRYPGTMR